MPDESAYNCGTCMFYVENKDKHGEEGFCIRYPPSVFPVPVNSIVGGKQRFDAIQMRPSVPRAMLCGEYQPKPSDTNIN